MDKQLNHFYLKKHNYNIGIFWADPFCGNLGVQALAYSTIFIFEEIAKNEEIEFNYSFYGSTGQLNDTIQLVGKTINCKNFQGLNYLKKKSWIKLLLQRKTGLKELFGLDLIVDIGGGDSYSDIYGEERFHTINSTKIMAKFLKKKIVLFPQTIGPYENKEIEKHAFKTLKNASLIFARDEKSFSYIKGEVLKEKLVNSIDCAFFLPYQKVNFDNEYRNVGINVSALLWHGGYTENNQFGLNFDYKEFTSHVLTYFSSLKNVKVHLVAHVIPPNIADYNSVENDYKICEILHSKYPETILAPKFTNPIEAKSYIGGLSFFTGARMHACIAAFSTGVPVFPLAYSRKFTGLFRDTLNNEFIGDMNNQNMNEVLSNLSEAFNSIETMKERIRNSQSIINDKSKELLVKISELIKIK